MTAMHTGYLVGIGSNIEPDDNISKIIDLILNYFPNLHLSRVLRIPPIGMNSHRDFLNMVIFIETDMVEKDLKTICNNIEQKLGRDRNDPARKMKDRSADLDILTAAKFPQDKIRAASEITDEYFLYPLIDELAAYLSDAENLPQQLGVTINVDGLSFGQTATTIHRNARSSNERVS
jgi:2-amino-4-hydroxy-6-hydroxymethyldihydropteridine diphosphokinase